MKEVILIDPNNQMTDRLAKLEQLASTFHQVKKNGKAESTYNGYASDWEDFEMWCNEHLLQSLPASPQVVAAYIADRAVNSWQGPSGKLRKMTAKPPLKLPTLLHRVFGIRFKHTENGFNFDTGAKEISEILDGLRRGNTCKENRKDPLVLDDIRKISEGCQPAIDDRQNNHVAARTAIRDRALLVLGFVSAMRRSEIASLNMRDIRFVENGIEVHIMQSKTGERELVIPYGSNPFTCPVRSLKAWLQEADIEEGYIFRSINRHGHISSSPLTPHSIALIIQGNEYVRKKTEEAKEKGEHVPSFGGHSLRAGFVTTAIVKGVPEDLIMSQTGHKKRDTLDKYIRRTNKWQENAATRIGL